jgi:hypothetical protein
MTKILSLGAAIALSALPTAAWAEPARCYTSDDGEYPCDFVATDEAGSFEISAPGKPSFSLIIEEPGVASGYGDYGTGSTFLPGRFHRAEDDRACWDNDATGARICAW